MAVASGSEGCGNDDDDNAVYLIFNGDRVKDIEKIPVKNITLIDIREKPKHRSLFYAMSIASIAVGILVVCELLFDVTWISPTMHLFLSGLCVAFVTSAGWLLFAKRYEVALTFSNGDRQLLE